MKNRISELRSELGIKQMDLASILHVKPNTISNWETQRTEPDFQSLEKMSEFFGVSIDYIVGNSCLRNPDKTLAVRIPVVGTVAAGLPLIAEDDILDYEEITPEMASRGKLFGLRVKGSSMEPRIREGDVVIVRRQETAETGDTVVVKVNGDEATVKRIRITQDGWTLIPANPSFDPMFFSPAEVASLPVCIIGKVVELRGKF